MRKKNENTESEERRGKRVNEGHNALKLHCLLEFTLEAQKTMPVVKNPSKDSSASVHFTKLTGKSMSILGSSLKEKLH